ncbi:MAG: hypothetical protein WCF06_06920 [Nitrososphaeraceae archaeon]
MTQYLENSFTLSLAFWAYALNASKSAQVEPDRIVSAAIKSLKEAAVKLKDEEAIRPYS